jgi:predicted lipid-binding transport protein (Tim44 family)
MSGTAVIRVLLGAAGAGLMVGALLVLFVGGVGGFVAAFWMLAVGAVLLIVAAIEITRYRSEQAERNRADPGPGGGETTTPEPRFKRTDEVFVDPTSHLPMRVYIDPRTGERRYVAEG